MADLKSLIGNPRRFFSIRCVHRREAIGPRPYQYSAASAVSAICAFRTWTVALNLAPEHEYPGDETRSQRDSLGGGRPFLDSGFPERAHWQSL